LDDDAPGGHAVVLERAQQLQNFRDHLSSILTNMSGNEKFFTEWNRRNGQDKDAITGHVLLITSEDDMLSMNCTNAVKRLFHNEKN
jgi:hypothetical protein